MKENWLEKGLEALLDQPALGGEDAKESLAAALRKALLLWQNRYSPSMVGWTKVGREIQPLSSPCPSNAQCLSKGGSATRSVQSLSNSCQIPVQSNTTWTDIGRKTLISSTLVLSATIYYLGQSLDKLATWTMC